MKTTHICPWWQPAARSGELVPQQRETDGLRLEPVFLQVLGSGEVVAAGVAEDACPCSLRTGFAELWGHARLPGGLPVPDFQGCRFPLWFSPCVVINKSLSVYKVILLRFTRTSPTAPSGPRST